ncbi:MAG: hypothetical protein R6V86_11770 [Spirochaetia bacterium]
MKPVYTVTRIGVEVKQQKMHVCAKLRHNVDSTEIDGYLPARETAALLPREIIIGTEAGAPEAVLDIMNELLEKLAAGRSVKVWEYQDKTYFSFLKWNTVRIASRGS